MHGSDNVPVTFVAGRRVLAHRVIWEDNHGAVPPGHYITHTADCQFDDCVEISHLATVETAEWVANRVQQQKYAWGQSHGNAKLTEDEARQILDSTNPIRELSSRFGVSRSTIMAIRAGRRWGHLNRSSTTPPNQTTTPSPK